MSVLGKLRAKFGSRKMRKAEAERGRKMAESRTEFQRLTAECGPHQTVCGTVRSDGQPVYFLADRDESDHRVEARAFERRHGRPMMEAERILQSKAAALTARGER